MSSKSSKIKTMTGNSLDPVAVGTNSMTDPVWWLAPIMLALATFVVFLPALQNQFVGWDDDKNFIDNPAYRGLGWRQLRWMFTTFHLGHYQPLSWVTLGLDYLLWGMNPIGYHLTNIIFHAANTVLFYLIGRRLLALALPGHREEQSWRINMSAAFAALLFSIHPLRVESVAWATERRDVLSGFFFFWTIDLYLRAVAASPGQFRRRWLGAAVVVYAFSLFSKATAMTLPVILAILDFYPLRRIQINPAEWFRPEVKAVWSEKLPFLALASIFAALALFAQHSIGALKPVKHYDFLSRLGQAFYGIIFYIWKTVLPINLSPLYELPYDPASLLPVFGLCAVATAAVSIAVYLLRSRWPQLLACWAFYVVSVAPVLGIAQSGHQLVADRYSYLPCLSWALLAAGLFFSLHRNVIAISAVPVGLVCLLGFLTSAQIGVWRDSRTFWQYVTAVAPDSSIAQYNLGKTFETEGGLIEAMQLYSRAVTLNPTNAAAQYNFARLLAQNGMVEEAVSHYRQALETNPDDADTHNNLGLLLALQGEREASLEELRKAIKIDPNHAKAYFNIGRILAQQGVIDEAAVNFQRALTISPNEAEIHLGLGDVLVRQGRLQAASAHFMKAVELKPGSAEAHVALARLLAAQGKTADAANQYQQALQLLKSQHPSPPEGP